MIFVCTLGFLWRGSHWSVPRTCFNIPLFCLHMRHVGSSHFQVPARQCRVRDEVHFKWCKCPRKGWNIMEKKVFYKRSNYWCVYNANARSSYSYLISAWCHTYASWMAAFLLTSIHIHVSIWLHPLKPKGETNYSLANIIKTGRISF